MKLRTLALTLLVGMALLLAPAALADEGAGPGGGPGGDLKAKIKQKMEQILELMRKNEAALLELSTGARAQPKRVDVTVPEGDQGAAAAPEGGAAEEGATKAKAARKLGELIEGQRSRASGIPGEMKRLVEMIPL